MLRTDQKNDPTYCIVNDLQHQGFMSYLKNSNDIGTKPINPPDVNSGQARVVILENEQVQLVYCAGLAGLAPVRFIWARVWTEPNSHSYWVKEAQVQVNLDKSAP